MKNILIAFRTIRNYSFYSIVNIVGLALSLACVITLARYVTSELLTDKFHPQSENIYFTEICSESGRVQLAHVQEYNENKSGTPIDLRKDAAVEAYTEVAPLPNSLLTYQKRQWVVNAIYCDTAFSKVFNYPILRGDMRRVYGEPNFAAITTKLATVLFGDEDPLGKTFDYGGRTLTVDAILKPVKSTMVFDILSSNKSLQQREYVEMGFVRIAQGTDIKAFNEKYNKIGEVRSWRRNAFYRINPLSELYFDRSTDGEMSVLMVHGDRDSVNMLIMVAVAVLIIGLFNFVNIYTVLMLRRSREVGVRKVFGAPYSSIVSMLYCENFAMILLALVAGWILTIATTDFTANVMGIPASDNMTFNLFLTLVILVVIPILTTIYPYFKYKYAKPITSLQNVSQSGKSIVARAILLVAQYVVTSTLIIVSIYFVRQLDFMLSSPVGYNTEAIIKAKVLPEERPYFETREQADEYFNKRESNIQIIEQTLNSHPAVINWYGGITPNQITSQSQSKFKIGDGEFKDVCYAYVSEKFMDICELKLGEGRFYNDTVDKFESYNIVVNRAFLRAFDIKDWQSVKMQSENRMWWSWGNPASDKGENPPFTIIGVIEDFQIGHLKEQMTPLAMFYNASSCVEGVCVKTTPERLGEVIAILQDLHSKMGSGDFKYTTVESELEAQYSEDKKITNVYTLFAIIAVFIGSLGLLSMSLYDIQQRRREIALRRVNGAKVGEIMSMLLHKYYILLSISFAISAPLAYFAIESYVVDFANRAPLSWWIYAVAALVTATVSLLTLVWQIRKAATENPANAMKTE